MKNVQVYPIVKALDEIIMLVLLGMCALPLTHGTWTYRSHSQAGPSRWHNEFPLCAETEQSPVDISTSNVWHSGALHSFDMIGYESIPRGAHWEIINTGKGVEISIEGDYTLREGGVEGDYKASYISFHWGADDHIGSEHTINGNAFPMEIQIVHYKKEFKNLDDAARHESGIVILSFLVEMIEGNEVGNIALTRIIDSLENITYKGDHTSLRPVPLFSILPLDMNNYYRYKGSLTHPPCYESVVWSVFRDPIKLSHKQMRKFRTKLSSKSKDEPYAPMMNNFRVIQDIGDRHIYSSDPKHASLLTAPLETPFSFTLAVFLGIVVMFVLLGRGGDA